MTVIEKQQLQQLQNAVTNMAIEITELKKMIKKNDAEIIGRSEEGIITLQELESTIKVLKNYKEQGFKSIEL